ncbi:MAG: TolC family protein [Planctomycetia bacterium]|nr:TolC family protein [Planctomycetia bacterium]
MSASGPSARSATANRAASGLRKLLERSRLLGTLAGWGKVAALGTSLSLVAFGCSSAPKDVVSRANDSSYGSQAEDNPCVSMFDVGGADNPLPTCEAPRTIRSADPSELDYWDMSLDEAINYALSHSRVMRDLGGTILTAPERMQTKYTAALVAADPRYGIEAALSEFDTRFSASGNFEKNHRLLNNVFFGGGTRNFQQDLNVYQAQFAKQTATGSQFFLRNFTDYNSNNAPGNQWYSAWNSNIEAQFRQPLMQGAGTDFNRIAGPSGSMGNMNGVLVARVNAKMSQAEFELGLRDFLSNVVNAYWDLYFAYRDLDAKVKARDAALEVWQKYAADQNQSKDRVLLAHEQYLRLDELVQNSLTGKQNFGTRTSNGTQGGTFQATSGVHVAERRLRLMMGMPITDRRLIRPSDEPKITEMVFNWDAVMCEAIDRRPELKRQRLKVRRREMELIATRNFLKPRLDATGTYRLRGFGKDLAGGPVGDASALGDRDSSAWGNLLGASFQEWQLGFEFSMALGMRQAHAAVHAAELQLARERTLLAEQERQIVHDLTNSLAEIDRAYSVCQTNLLRFQTTSQVVDILLQRLKSNETVDFDRLLDAQRRMVDAESSFYLSQVEFEVAAKNVYYERNALLDYYGLAAVDGMDNDDSDSSLRLMKTQSATQGAPMPAPAPNANPAPAPLPPKAASPAPAPLPAPEADGKSEDDAPGEEE